MLNENGCCLCSVFFLKHQIASKKGLIKLRLIFFFVFELMKMIMFRYIDRCEGTCKAIKALIFIKRAYFTYSSNITLMFSDF